MKSIKRPVTFTSVQNWQIYPNWPNGHPDGPALETQDTFDGAGQVVKHVHHTRHDDTYDNGGYLIYTMSDTTTITYYLHSTVLAGKTIAQLDQNGNKKEGYVYAGGVRLATQTISGSSSSVEIELTNPVTGATVQTDADGNYATRQEPDPLGRDFTSAPDPLIVVDPIASMKLNEPMPVEYAAHWTGELESGMNQYVDTMDMVRAREAYIRWLKSEMTNNRERRIWEEILYRNPNVGIVKGEKTLWGKDGANFLIENSGSITLGANGIMFRPQDPTPWPVDTSLQGLVDDPKGFPCPPTLQEALDRKGGKGLAKVLNSTWELAKQTNQEEGGWVYMNRRGQVKGLRKDRDRMWDLGDDQARIVLGAPPRLKGWRVIGTFHTHDIDFDPSQPIPMGGGQEVASDIRTHQMQGVPGIILGGAHEGETAAFTFFGPPKGFMYYGLPKKCR